MVGGTLHVITTLKLAKLRDLLHKMRMQKVSAEQVMARIKNGEAPDFIQAQLNLTPNQQHKLVRDKIAYYMRGSLQRMRRKKEYPFNRGNLDFREMDCALVRIEAWMKIRSLKRKYDRMNKAEKAANKESFARQIDAMLMYYRAAYEIGLGTFDAEEYKLTYGN